VTLELQYSSQTSSRFTSENPVVSSDSFSSTLFRRRLDSGYQGLKSLQLSTMAHKMLSLDQNVLAQLLAGVRENERKSSEVIPPFP
jgi:hypothetical protein